MVTIQFLGFCKYELKCLLECLESDLQSLENSNKVMMCASVSNAQENKPLVRVLASSRKHAANLQKIISRYTQVETAVRH